jgi:hypothetical protein
MAIGTAEIYRTKNVDFFITFYVVFTHFSPFWRLFGKFPRKKWVVGIHVVQLASLPYCCTGLPSAVGTVMLILSQLLWPPSMHAVAGFTVFARIPAFDSVHTVLAVLLLLSFLLLLASRLWKAFLLLLASFKFLMVSCCWALCYFWRYWCSKGVVGVSTVPFQHTVAGGPAVTGGPTVAGFPAVEDVLAVASVLADPGVHILAGGFTYWIVDWDVLHYRAMAIGLSFFSAIELSEYRISYWPTQETIGLSDIK